LKGHLAAENYKREDSTKATTTKEEVSRKLSVQTFQRSVALSVFQCPRSQDMIKKGYAVCITQNLPSMLNIIISDGQKRTGRLLRRKGDIAQEMKKGAEIQSMIQQDC